MQSGITARWAPAVDTAKLLGLRGPDSHGAGFGLHLRRRHHRGAAGERARDAVPRAQRDP